MLTRQSLTDWLMRLIIQCCLYVKRLKIDQPLAVRIQSQRPTVGLCALITIHPTSRHWPRPLHSRWIHQNMASPLLHPEERRLFHRLQREAWGVQWPQPSTTQQLLCGRSVQWMKHWHSCFSSECRFPCGDPVLSRRVSADEDGATPAQHVCHPLPSVDLRHRAHLPRRQQWGEVWTSFCTQTHSETSSQPVQLKAATVFCHVLQ